MKILATNVNQKPREFEEENPDKEEPPLHEHKEEPPKPPSKPVI